MKASRTLIRALIRVAPSAQQADELIVENYGFETIREKIAFLKGMFDVEVFAREVSPSSTPKEDEEKDYYAMLTAIMNS